jgi:DNA-binding CsgD family transcriptional regulator
MNAGGLNLLSPRELQVVHYLAEGLTNREIGERLGLSRHTVKNYLLKIFDKLGVSNRVELVFLKLSQPAPVIQTLRESESPKRVARETIDGREMRRNSVKGISVLEE